ncbi:MAG TPA: iron ABC transporter permease [Crocinitomicaceae bacterium]|nr:iron ABC transporter permease [Crocinitomicaceae bacterium]
MILSKKHSIILLALLICIPIFALVHLSVGQINISPKEFWQSLINFNDQIPNEIIAREIRIPRMFMALIAGASLSVVGLLMQTLFNNPLAGPYVLGINSGSSLFVALSIMTGVPFFASDLGIITNALIGAFLFGLVILFFSRLVRTQIALLLVGLMLGSFISAFVSFIQSASDAQELKVFTLWALGSLQKVEFTQLPIIFLITIIGIIGAFLIIKPLNILILGENEAKLLGVNIKRVRLVIIIITAILTGLVTAFCGPIAFVGLAVPNLVRILFKTQQHFILITASLLMGALFILICDIIIQLAEPFFMLPINVLTSIIGAPMVIFFILNRLR